MTYFRTSFSLPCLNTFCFSSVCFKQNAGGSVLIGKLVVIREINPIEDGSYSLATDGSFVTVT